MRLQATLRPTSDPNVSLVAIRGDIDVESRALVAACIESACRTDGPTVELDLGGVRRLDAAGVRALLDARSIVEDAGRTFVLSNVSPAVAAALDPALRVVPDPQPEPVDVDELVRTHHHLAERLAMRFTGRGQPAEDLVQVACVGLVTAARRYDPARGVQFATFAQATIVGELKKYFRDHAWQLHVARPVQELYLAVRAASEEMTHACGRTPTPAELAARLGATEEQVVESLEARSALHVDSLDRPRDDDDAPRYEEAWTEDGYRVVEERSWLVPALRLLPERERQILKLRFFDGLPQSAIAERVGISQMHVSRLLARSLATLRAAATDGAAAG